MNSPRPKAREDAREIPVRLSHLLRHCSVGAIVRDADRLMVVPDISRWDKPGDHDSRRLRYVDQVRQALGIEQDLRTPPIAFQLRDDEWSGWIPVQRFPRWTRCTRCGLLCREPWQQSNEARCSQAGCGGTLEQVPWVLIHERGYLADVPWHAVAHAGSRSVQRECEWRDNETYLRIKQEERLVTCDRCRAASKLPVRFPFPETAWQQPWLREPPPPLDERAWLVEVNDVRVHSTDTPTALVIPPESRVRRGSVVDQLYGSTGRRRLIESAANQLQRRSQLRQVAGEYRCTVEEVEQALQDITDGYPSYGRRLDERELADSEYQALCHVIPDLRDDEDFVTRHHTEEWHRLRSSLEVGTFERQISEFVDRVVSVRKLKEVMVLKGFRRGGYTEQPPTPPDVAGDSSWLPAIELFGEGVFFTFDERLLQRWEQEPAAQARARQFEQRHHHQRELNRSDLEVTPRFLMCHTLAHLLIRRLEAEAGYPAASLKERIYTTSGSATMAGILIYVAVADEQGSMGGLMEQANPMKFLRLLVAACEAAQWCSLDPVCAGQAGHGPYQLNRAACHACALVPETSCSYGNVLLDRAFVAGDGAGLRPIWGSTEEGA